MKTFLDLWRYLAEFFLKWEMFWIQIVEKIKTYFIFNNFFRKSFRLWYNVEKCGGVREPTGDNINTAHALFMLDK